MCLSLMIHKSVYVHCIWSRNWHFILHVIVVAGLSVSGMTLCCLWRRCALPLKTGVLFTTSICTVGKTLMPNRPFAANNHMLGYRIATPCWRASCFDKQRIERVRAWFLQQKNSVFCPLIPDILVFKSNSWIDLCVFWVLNPTETFFGAKFTHLPMGNGSNMATSRNQEVLSSNSAQSTSCSSLSGGDLETADPPRKSLVITAVFQSVMATRVTIVP